MAGFSIIGVRSNFQKIGSYNFTISCCIFSEKDQAHKGRYKSANNTVVMINQEGERVILFDPTPPYLIKPEMEMILAWTTAKLETRELHSLLVIANFIFLGSFAHTNATGEKNHGKGSAGKTALAQAIAHLSVV